jgi:hypothetical protein
MTRDGEWLLVYEVWDSTGAFRRSEIVKLEGNIRKTALNLARRKALKTFETAKQNPALNRPEKLPLKFLITFSLRNPILRYEERLETNAA